MSMTRIGSVVVVAGLALACLVPGAAAQQLTSVLLPVADVSVPPDGRDESGLGVSSGNDYAPTAVSLLTFDPSALPRGAVIQQSTLLLTARPSNSAFASQLFKIPLFDPATVNWADLQPIPATDPALAGSIRPGVFPAPYSESEGLSHALQSAVQDRKQLSIMVQTQAYKGKMTFESTAASDAAVRPRLVVEYTLAARATLDWPQPQYDASRSGRTPWTSNVFPGAVEFGRDAIFSAANGIYQNPILFDRKLCFAIDQKSSGNTILLVEKDGTVVSQRSGIKNPPTRQIVVDPNGILYYPTLNGIQLYQLNDDLAPAPPTAGTGRLSKLIVKAAPTIGVDGGVFLSTEESVTAYTVTAYTPYPQLEEYWSVAIKGTSISSIVLSPNGDLAYVAALRNGLVELHALDAVTGAKVAQWTSKSLTEPKLPTPVAAQDAVLLAINDASSPGRLLAFPAPSIPPIDGAVLVLPWNPWWTAHATKGAVSQAALASGADPSAVTLHDDKIWAYALTSTSEPVVRAKASLEGGTPSNITVDGDGNVVLVNGNQLKAFDTHLKPHYSATLPTQNAQPGVLMAPDGTIFTHGSSAIYAALPKLVSPPVPVSKTVSAATDGLTVRAVKGITVEGGVTLDPFRMMILQSGGSVSVNAPFAVSPGAVFAIEIEAPPTSSPESTSK